MMHGTTSLKFMYDYELDLSGPEYDLLAELRTPGRQSHLPTEL